MAADPAELWYPEFGPGRMYDKDIIAADVIWPLVDANWGKCWLDKSYDGCELRIAHQVKRAGKLLIAELEADCTNSAEPDEEDCFYREATLYFEEEVDEHNRDIFLEAAHAIADMLQAELEESGEFEENESYVWPEGDETDFKLRGGRAFMISSDGDFSMETYRVIDAPEVVLSVPVLDEEADGSSDGYDRVREHDLDTLQKISEILLAPSHVKAAIGRVRQHPITIY